MGNGTKTRRSGECTFCSKFEDAKCKSSKTISNESFIEYNCKKAVRDSDIIKLIILYIAETVDRNKCPDEIKAYGKHVPM